MAKYIQCVSNDNVNVTPIETIYAIKNAGFDGVFIQWSNKDWEISQEEQLKTARELGLEVPFVHLGYKGINNIWLEGEEGEKLVDGYIKDLAVCKENGIDMVVMHLTSKSVAPPANMIGVQRFQKIVNYAEQLGIKIAFENTKIWGYLEYVFERIKNPNIGICFDAGHCHCHFDGKFSWDIFKDKIFALHLHDNDQTGDQHLLPFDGTMDWKKLEKDLGKTSYKGSVILESVYSERYTNMSLDEFYKLAFERAQQIRVGSNKKAKTNSKNN